MTVQLSEPITAAALAVLLGCPAPETDVLIRYVATDARETTQDTLFCALPGHLTDGHLFIRQATQRGCRAVLCTSAPKDEESRRCPDGSQVAFICTGNVTDALFWWADSIRSGFRHPVIAVTGSMGKTTCKEFLRCLLSPLGPVFATPGNHNSTIGVPLSLLTLDTGYRAAVVELGMNHAGEISRLSRLVRPDAAVITAVGRAHIGLLGSEEAIFRAKCEIADGMTGGPVWIPAQDKRFDGWSYPHKITFGPEQSGADARYSCIPASDGSRFTLTFSDGTSLSGKLPFTDPVTAEAALRAAEIAHTSGVPEDALTDALARLKAPPSRMEIIDRDRITVINDAYNAAPEAVAAALSCLGGYRDRRRLAVLGEMGELGSYAEDIHCEIGRLAAAASPCRLWYKGRYISAFLEGVSEGGLSPASVTILDAAEGIPEIADRIRAVLRPEDVLLIKGAHGTGLHRLASILLQKKE